MHHVSPEMPTHTSAAHDRGDDAEAIDAGCAGLAAAGRQFECLLRLDDNMRRFAGGQP
jgi:hypothetical protein